MDVAVKSATCKKQSMIRTQGFPQMFTLSSQQITVVPKGTVICISVYLQIAGRCDAK